MPRWQIKSLPTTCDPIIVGLNQKADIIQDNDSIESFCI